MKRLIECVPNFSEGRDPAKVDAIASAMSSVSGVYVLDREMDADHNRSVITLAGEPDAVAEAALRGAWAFVRTYFVRLGFLDGAPGFALARYNAHTTHLRYMKLWRLGRSHP